jgi:hypothetical protein
MMTGKPIASAKASASSGSSILGQEAVARVDGVGAGDLGGGDEVRDPEIRVAAGRRTDADVVVREADVQALPVGLGIDRDRLEPELSARANDPQGDLPAVGDEHFLEHYWACLGRAGKSVPFFRSRMFTAFKASDRGPGWPTGRR